MPICKKKGPGSIFPVWSQWYLHAAYRKIEPGPFFRWKSRLEMLGVQVVNDADSADARVHVEILGSGLFGTYGGGSNSFSALTGGWIKGVMYFSGQPAIRQNFAAEDKVSSFAWAPRKGAAPHRVTPYRLVS
jgi:hypothetical protein